MTLLKVTEATTYENWHKCGMQQGVLCACKSPCWSCDNNVKEFKEVGAISTVVES